MDVRAVGTPFREGREDVTLVAGILMPPPTEARRVIWDHDAVAVPVAMERCDANAVLVGKGIIDLGKGVERQEFVWERLRRLSDNLKRTREEDVVVVLGYQQVCFEVPAVQGLVGLGVTPGLALLNCYIMKRL